VRTRTVPAVAQIAIARAALVRADNAAIHSFTTNEVQLAGPGEEYQNQIAIAGQSLTLVAENNMAGGEGSRALQLVEGLLVTYTAQIEQADAHFRQPRGEALGTVDLWSASRMLHNPDGGILAQLDTLLNKQYEALDNQLLSNSMTPRSALTLFVPIVGLVALLLSAQVAMWRRFRRRVNLWLVLAVVLLIALSMVTSRNIVSQHHLKAARTTLNQLVGDRQKQTSVTDVEGQHALLDQVRDACDQPDGCGDTVARFITAVDERGRAAAGPDDSRLIDETQKVNEETAAAGADSGLEPSIYILTLLIAAAVLLGFRPRLNEYRYRPR
jgi:hypothetical protein